MHGWSEARRLGHDWAGDVHMLIALARLDGVAGDVLRKAGVSPERVSAELERALHEMDPVSPSPSTCARRSGSTFRTSS
jgi:ATP-dependent Clp protease ATP-binding subunit ClpA